MSKLIWLPERPAESSEPPRVLARHGKTWLSAPLPAAGEACIAVVPAGVYQWHALTLPKLPRHKRAAAAASLLEPQLIVDVERTVFAVQPSQPDGRCAVAVLDQSWIDDAQAWLKAQQIHPRRWIPETALLPQVADAWTLFLRDDEWVLSLGPDQHWLLDQRDDGATPSVFRAVLEAGAAPRECLICGLPGHAQRAEQHTPIPPLWLATCGLRARVSDGTDWLQPPSGQTPDLAPEGSRSWAWPRMDFKRWRLPLTLAALALGVQGLGLAAQYLQWRGEAQALTQQISEAQSRLSLEAQALQEPAANQMLAQQLSRVVDLDLAPPAVTRLQYDNGKLFVELDPKRIDVRALSQRVNQLGGELTTAANGAPLLRFTSPDRVKK